MAATCQAAMTCCSLRRRQSPDTVLPSAHPFCAYRTLNAVRFVHCRSPGLEAKLEQPRGLRTGQLLLIGAVWAGCIAAFEAGLGRLAPPPAVPPPAAAASSAEAATADIPGQLGPDAGADTGEAAPGEGAASATGVAAAAAPTSTSQPTESRQGSAAAAASGGAITARGTTAAPLERRSQQQQQQQGQAPSSNPTSSPTSFWEDGRVLPYLLAVMAAVPVAVGWARRWGRG